MYNLQIKAMKKNLLTTAMSILLGLMIIMLPLGFILVDNWFQTLLIEIITIYMLISSGSKYIKYLVVYWNDPKEEKYITHSLTIVMFSVGLAIAAAFFSHLVSFDWCGMLLIAWGILGLVITTVIAGITCAVLWTITCVHKFTQKLQK